MKRIILFASGFSLVCILIVMVFLHVIVPAISANASLIPKRNELSQADRFVKKITGGGWVYDAIQTRDGDYLTLSRTSSAFIIRKITSTGNLVWATSIQINFGNLNAIAETKDGYVLAGSRTELGFYYYYYFTTPILIKLDRNGKITEQSVIRGTASRIFSEIIGNPDGTYVAVGDRSTVIKFKSVSKVLWAKTYQFNSNICCLHSQRTPNNSLILAQSAKNGAEVIKISASGKKIWGNRVQVSKFAYQTLGVTSNNGVILAGTCVDCKDLMLVALDAQGELAWTARYSLNVAHFGVSSVIPTHDGGYALTGRITDKSGAPRSGFLLKIDSSRNVVFQNMFGVPRNWEEGRAIFATSNDGYVVFGTSGHQDSLVLNLNSNGALSGCTFFEPLSSTVIPFGTVAVDHSNISVSGNVDVSPAFFSVSSNSLKEHYVNACP